MLKLVYECGGKVEDNLFVTDPGCKIIHITKPTNFANDLFKEFNIANTNEFESIGEFNARLCYLTFNSNKKTNLTDTIIDLGHLSVFNDIHITFLIAGISDEVTKEFVSHNEAKVSRLTSSKTNAQNNTLYRVFGNDNSVSIQKKYINKFISLRQEYVDDQYSTHNISNVREPIEIINMFNLGTKCSVFTFSMNIKDYHKLFIGRIPEHGNEHDVILICKKMCRLLHELFPKLIREVEWYEKANNNTKYNE